MDIPEIKELLGELKQFYSHLSDVRERALEFAEKDPYKLLVLGQTTDWVGRLRLMLLKELDNK